MTEDRLYRFLIPGCIFLILLIAYLALAYVLPIHLWPESKPVDTHIYHLLIGAAKSGIAVVAIGGGLVLVVVGYLCSEIVQLLDCAQDARWLNNWLRRNAKVAPQVFWQRIRRRCGIDEGLGQDDDENYQRILLIAFVHYSLANEAKDIQGFLQRSWSRILVALYSATAATLASLTMMFVLFFEPPLAAEIWCTFVWILLGLVPICGWIVANCIVLQSSQERGAIYWTMLNTESEDSERG